MSFINSSVSFSRLLVLDEVNSNFWQNFSNLLKKYAFEDIDDQATERAYGWTNFDDFLDTRWEKSIPEKAEYVCFSLRLDTRRIAPAIMKKHQKLAMQNEEAQMQAQGKKFISKDRKIEIKEQVKLRLMTRTLPTPAEFQVVWNTQKNVIYFASTQNKMIDMFMEHFTKSFDLHLQLITPYSLAMNILGSDNEYKLDDLAQTKFTY